jgi:hypothetical protein
LLSRSKPQPSLLHHFLSQVFFLLGWEKNLTQVRRYTRERRWVAKITADGVTRILRYFTDETRPARAYDSATKTYHGRFAAINFHDSKG